MQRTLKEQLKRGLSTLPVPKNDYEIVVPKEEMDTESGTPGEGELARTYISVEDQADIDARIEAERKKQNKFSCLNSNLMSKFILFKCYFRGG